MRASRRLRCILSGPVAHLLISGGKEGILYLVDRDNMGQFQAVSNSQIVQSFFADQGSFTTPAFWQNNLYIAGAYQGNTDNLRTYSFTPASGQFNATTASASVHSFFFPGATPVVSAVIPPQRTRCLRSCTRLMRTILGLNSGTVHRR